MTPCARIEVNGSEIGTRTAKHILTVLETLTVTDEAGHRADRLDITIDDASGAVSIAKGDEIRVWLGYEPTPVYMGRYKAESVRKSGPVRRLTITATAAELRGAIRVRKTRSHHDTTLGEIAARIAAEHGLTAAVAPELARLAIAHIDQQTESDLAFMERLANRSGAVFKIADGKLLLSKTGSKTLPSGAANVSTTIRPVDCESYDWESGTRGNHEAVVCRYREGARDKTVTAGNADATLKHRDRRLYASKAEAEASARAQLDDFARGAVSATIECERGVPEAFADSEVRLAGFDGEIDGAYRVKTATHRLDGGGLRTSLELEMTGH